jgi:hypothetical protein
MIDHLDRSKDDVKPWHRRVRALVDRPRRLGRQPDRRPARRHLDPRHLDEATCEFVDPKVWVGYLAQFGTATSSASTASPAPSRRPSSSPTGTAAATGPYGGALDKQRPWFTGLRGELLRINTARTRSPSTAGSPRPGNTQSYGMTVDPDGNPWMAGCSGPVSTFDPRRQTWTADPRHQRLPPRHRGRPERPRVGRLQRPLRRRPRSTTRPTPSSPTTLPCSTADRRQRRRRGLRVARRPGHLGLEDRPEERPRDAAGQHRQRHYVYSDMTGGQLKSVGRRPDQPDQPDLPDMGPARRP